MLEYQRVQARVSPTSEVAVIMEKQKNLVTKDLSLDLPSYSNISPFMHIQPVNQLTEPFRLIIQVMKALGNTPITSKSIRVPQKPDSVLIFEINYMHWPTLLSGVMGLFTILLWSLFFINIGLGYSFLVSNIISYKDFDILLREEENSANPVRGMVQRTYLITSFIAVVEMISRWYNAPKFIHFLNKWEAFERKLAQVFPLSDYDTDFSPMFRLRNNLIIFYLTYPSMVLIPTFLVVYCSRWNFVVKILGVLIVFQFIAVALVEDIKVLMSYKALQLAFKQVRHCIQRFAQLKGAMTAETALSWRQLVQLIRDQCERASRFQKFEELCRLIGYTGLVTMFVYIILNGWDHAQKRGSILFLLSSFGYGMMLMGRTYFKAVMADSISQAEAGVARSILQLDTRNWNNMTVLELKCLVDTILLSPAKISFGNYIVLNKRLLLAICGQIVTYLIVMMQFSQSSN